jgi:hypothetical protein
MDEFEDVTFVARVRVTHAADAAANSRKCIAIAKVLGCSLRQSSRGKQLHRPTEDDKLRQHILPDDEHRLRTRLADLLHGGGNRLHRPGPMRGEMRHKSIKAIDARGDLQDAYVADMKRKMQKTVWQNATCTAFYRKNMREELTRLSPEPVAGFILSRRWFRLGDCRLLN